MFALLKVDKVMASTLPIGKYPILSVDKVTVIVILSWILSFGVSILVNNLFPCSYEPAVVLCIPVLPIGFFITVFSCFCIIFSFIIIGFLCSIVYLKKKQAQIHNMELAVSRVDYKALEENAITTFLVTMSHVVLYIPTMLVVGLHGWILPPGAILLCDFFVYSEFLIHPILLLIASTKMRKEILKGSQNEFKDHFQNLFKEISWCMKVKKKKETHKTEKINISNSRPNNISLRITNNTIPNLGSCDLKDQQVEQEEKYQEELEECEGVPISVSIYSMRSEYAIVPSRSPSTESAHSQIHVEPYSLQNETADLPKIVTTEVPTQMKSNNVSKNRVPITCSWPSLDRQVSVNTPSIGSTQTNSYSEPYNNKRLSANCDSGYSEMDICSVGNEGRECLPGMKEKLSKFSQSGICVQPPSFYENMSSKSYRETKPNISNDELIVSPCWAEPVLQDLQLCFNLDHIVEISDEEKYFQEIADISICSYDSKDGSSTEYRPAQLLNELSIETSESQHPPVMFEQKPVIAPAQFSSLRTFNSFYTHNVSKKYLESLKRENFNSLPTLTTDYQGEQDLYPISVKSHTSFIEAKLPPIPPKLTQTQFSRGDSLKSLPITPFSRAVFPDLMKLSIPAANADPIDIPSEVILVEHSPRSKEIYI